MSWNIAKQFDFDYGHRVWTQSLDNQYSLDNQCVCKHYHGHRGTIMVYLESDILNPQGMVWDFKNLNFFKKFIDTELDHKMILDIKDPSLLTFFQLARKPNLKLKNPFDSDLVRSHYWTVADDVLNEINDPHIKEIYEGLVLVPFVPTSEYLSKWFYQILNDYLTPINIRVSKIQFYETPKSQSNYEETY